MYCVVQYSFIVFCVVLRNIVQYFVVLCSVVLYCIVLYNTAHYCHAHCYLVLHCSTLLPPALNLSTPLSPNFHCHYHCRYLSSQVHSGRISEQTAVYLSHLTSYVLQTIRYRVSPPIALRIDRSKGNCFS